ncbi:TPA: class I SAM-dependent methyltransferase family protein [Candidatus Bathyarchaeota archaeon]|nr:class I SAM-dependent methyltransferase family protein [Candidatus Bathyarchaeota archaeon]
MSSLKEYLAERLEAWELKLLPSSYDIVGDIAIIRLPDELKHRAEEIAKAIMQINSHVKTVLNQASPVSGDFRLRQLEWITGEKKTETIHREHGCLFKVDLEKCYFSPRLSFERSRVASQVKPSEIVVNMFAGVGCFSILIAKRSKARRVYSIDINPWAIKYAEENIRLNRVGYIVTAILGDAKNVIRERLKGAADRVLMPLPEKAYEYIDFAIESLKPHGGVIHYYDFVHAGKDENPIRKVEEKISRKLCLLKMDFEVNFGRIVRTIGPRWFQISLDIGVNKKD